MFYIFLALFSVSWLGLAVGAMMLVDKHVSDKWAAVVLAVSFVAVFASLIGVITTR